MRILRPALCLLLGSAPALAQCEIARLEPAPVLTISGAASAGDTLALAGSANRVAIFELGAAGWFQSAAFTSPGKFLLENPRLTTDGQRVLVGMTEDGPTLNAEGRVYVFDRSNNWQQPIQLAASDLVAFDTFGSGLAIDGDTLLVGASMMVFDVVCGPGKAYIFEHNGTDWVQSAEFKPYGQTSSMGGYGVAVDLEGDLAVVGAGMDDSLLDMAGAVYLYERGAQGWRELAKLFADDPAPYEGFGTSVALDGQTLVVGTPGPSASAGKVYVLEPQASGWSQVQVLKPSNGSAGDAFGTTVALAGDHLVVGATGVDVPGGTKNVGSIYAFERIGGTWVEVSQAVADDAAPNALFGRIVHLSGNQVLWTGWNQGQARLHSLGIDRGASYCTSTPNSSGAQATISAEGCDSVLAGQLSLRVEGAPPGEFGLFAFAANAAQTPFGNGSLCLAAPFERLAGGTIDGAGRLELALDFTSAPADQMTPGDSWYFQAFFRDPGFGAGFGSSDAIALQLQP